MTEMGYSTAGFERTVHRIDGVETVVYEIGAQNVDRPPMVYFHGGGTYHGFDWAREFADSFRVILPHHPNFGESGDAEFDSLADYVMHYEMLFASLGLGVETGGGETGGVETGLERFHLVGASMGGHLAARYAGDHPDEIGRLVLVSPAGLKSDTASIPDYTKLAPDQLRAMFVESTDWLEPYWPAQPSAAWMALRAREQAAAMQTREQVEVADAKLRAALAGFDRPTLLLWGSADQIVSTGFIPEWQGLMPDAALELIDGGAHLLLDENAAARAALRSFLMG